MGRPAGAKVALLCEKRLPDGEASGGNTGESTIAPSDGDGFPPWADACGPAIPISLHRPGVSQGALLDPSQLAPKVGLCVMDGETALALLPDEDRMPLCGRASRSWSGGVLLRPLPDGSHLCILNPRYQKRRNKVTLMEEITHNYLKHKPTKVTLRGGTIEVRDFEKQKPTVPAQQL